MNNLFVSYQESFELKELGFDEPCICYVDQHNNPYIYNFELHPDEFIYRCHCDVIKSPIFSQAFDFFEKKFNLYGDTYTYTEEFGNKQPKFGWEIRDYGEQWGHKADFSTRTDAIIDCIKNLISIAKESPEYMFAFGYVLPEERVFKKKKNEN